MSKHELHPICARCLRFLNPFSPDPPTDGEPEKCCFCGKKSVTKTSVKVGPWDPKCRGKNADKISRLP